MDGNTSTSIDRVHQLVEGRYIPQGKKLWTFKNSFGRLLIKSHILMNKEADITEPDTDNWQEVETEEVTRIMKREEEYERIMNMDSDEEVEEEGQKQEKKDEE